MLLDDKPAPVVTLQVKDTEQGQDRLRQAGQVHARSDNDEFGWTLTDDYIVGSDSTGHAEAIVAAGKKAPLAEDADFQKWTEEAGGAGHPQRLRRPQERQGPLRPAWAAELAGADG